MHTPPAPAWQATYATPAAAAVAKGLALVERSDLPATATNGEGTRCNVETMAGESLEGTHPTIAAGPAVGVQGWYAAAGTPAASTPAATDAAAKPAAGDAPAADATAAAAPAPAAATATAGPLLVLASENGVNHWVAQLPALTERKDVAKALNDASLTHTGFDVQLDLSGLRPGFYSMHLSDASHSAASVCGVGRGFVIK
jgi:hypothetical protein